MDADGNVIVGAGGVSTTVADGADVNQGTTTDAANTTGAAGTMSGKLRGLLTIIANVWDSVNTALRMIPYTTSETLADGLSNVQHTAWGSSGGRRREVTFPYQYNGNSWDKFRMGPQDPLTLFALGTRSTTQTGPNVTNQSRGLLIYLKVTVASGTGGLQVVVDYRDYVLGNICQFTNPVTPITAVGDYLYLIYPGAGQINLADTVKQIAQTAVPRGWRARIIHGDASSYEYSVSVSVLG